MEEKKKFIKSFFLVKTEQITYILLKWEKFVIEMPCKLDMRSCTRKIYK